MDEERVSTLPREVDNVKQAETIEIVVDCLVDSVNKGKDCDKISSIYLVPSRLRDLDPRLFTPRVVSIGPLHKEKMNLRSMEARKAAYLSDLLSEVGSIKETLTKCVQKVNDNIERIKACYDGMKTAYNDVELVQMMVMDACFILQFISKLSGSGNILSDNRLRSRSIALDLVLLENQIPFFVLKDIYEIITVKKLQSRTPLITMLCNLLAHINPFKECIKMDNLGPETTHDHILGLLHKVYLSQNPDVPKISVLPTAHSAVELDKIGVKFRPKDEDSWALVMEFQSSSHKPTLRMPVVVIDNFFEVVVKNLIVYDLYGPVNNYVTSYAMALDMLVASLADIAKLGESDVLVNHLGSNEKASDMIKKNICNKDVTFLDFYYIDSWKKMDIYYKSYWSKCIGVLKQKYFSSPLKAVGLLAAIIIFIITVVQFPFQIKQS